MGSFVEIWNILMVVCVFGGLLASAVLLYAFVAPHGAYARTIMRFTGKNILWIGFLISLSAVVSSLVYSEIIGYPPCLFCWWARVFFYPQVIIFAIALIKKDGKAVDYSLGLSLFGLLISTYHYIVETVGYSPLPCEAQGVSCLVRYVHELGFITIPFMGLVGFFSLTLALLVAKRAFKTNTYWVFPNSTS